MCEYCFVTSSGKKMRKKRKISILHIDDRSNKNFNTMRKGKVQSEENCKSVQYFGEKQRGKWFSQTGQVKSSDTPQRKKSNLLTFTSQ